MRKKGSTKSQVTPFILLGIGLIAVIIVLTSVFFKDNPIDDDVRKAEGIVLTKDSVVLSIQACMARAKPIIIDIVRNGGELEFSQDPLLFNGRRFNFWCSYDEAKGCKNKVFSKEKLEAEISDKVKDHIDVCLDLSVFTDLGFTIEIGDTVVETVIGTLDVSLYMKKDAVFKKGETQFELDEYSHKFDLAVGRMFDVANHILNEEILNSHFEKDEWMREHGAEIEIRKFRPYPHTAYNLWRFDKNTGELLELNFAIEGKDTISNVAGDYTINPGKWCLEGDMCLFNPEESLCNGQMLQGNQGDPNNNNNMNNMPARCINTQPDYYPTCEGTGGNECLDCGHHKHGEEWCEYDGVVGNGLDFVGTRHYKVSCINGNEFVEPCRDYREEICVTNYSGPGSNSEAICRQNRWKSCMMQQSPTECKDSSQRDCVWDTTLQFEKNIPKDGNIIYKGNPRPKCFPQVPPGFKFWQLSGAQACQWNNEWVECDGVKCPPQWSEDSLRTCRRIGDCGTYYTISNAFSNLSFKHTDMLPPENSQGLQQSSQGTQRPTVEQLLHPENLVSGKYKLELYPIDDYPVEQYSTDAFSCADCTVMDLLNRAQEYSDYLGSLDKEELEWEYVTNGAIHFHTRHFSFCGPFLMMEEGDCRQCTSPYCTEYMCKSIGKNCLFYKDDQGYGRCEEFQLSNDKPVIIASSLDGTPYDYDDFESDIFVSDIMGKSLKHTVQPFSSFNISFDTSTKTQCKKGLLPIPYVQFPIDLDFAISNPDFAIADGESGFSTEHAFTLYAFPAEYFLDDINSIINLANYMELSHLGFFEQKLDEIEADVLEAAEEFKEYGDHKEEIKEKFRVIRQHYLEEGKPFVEEIYARYNSYITYYTSNVDINKMTIFFNCMDEFGNENEEQFFISYTLEEDNTPPLLLAGVVNNDEDSNLVIEMEATLNEPSECRASVVDQPYLDMEYIMNCTTNYYGPNSGYTCTKNISKADINDCTKNSIYFRCRDQIYNPDPTQTNVNTESYTVEFEIACS